MAISVCETHLLEELDERLARARRRVWIVAPYQSRVPAQWLARRVAPGLDGRILVRWDPEALQRGALSAIGLETLVDRGFAVRSVRDLHAKAYVVDDWAYLGSANWTLAALGGENLELGVTLTGPDAEALAARVAEWWDGADNREGHLSYRKIARWAGRERRRGPHPEPVMAVSSQASGAKLGDAQPLPLSVVRSRAAERFLELRDELSRGLVKAGGALPLVSSRKVHRTRAYRACAALVAHGDAVSDAARQRLLLEVLERHRDSSARAHAAYRLAQEEWPRRLAPRAVRDALAASRRTDPAAIVRRAARAASTTLARRAREALAREPLETQDTRRRKVRGGMRTGRRAGRFETASGTVRPPSVELVGTRG